MKYEVNESLTLEQRKEKALKQVLEAIGPGKASTWKIVDGASIDGGPDGPSLKGQLRKGVEGPDVLGLLFTMTFPGINLESAWVSAMDFTARSAYDLRFVDPKFF